MLDIVTSFAICELKIRNDEFLFAFDKNISNEFINSITVITEDVNVKNLIGNLPKVNIINTKLKPLFLDLVNESNNKNNIVAITNSDIYFDSTIKYINNLQKNEAYCLTRWNPSVDILNLNIDKITYWDHNDARLSFDTYIFKPKLNLKNINFEIGILGCDNRFAYELADSGLKIINPSKLIKTFHVHSSNIRNYTKKRLNGNYLRVELSDSFEYNEKNVSKGWNEGDNFINIDDWNWVPECTDIHYIKRKDIPLSIKRYFNYDLKGKRRPII